MPNIYDMLMPQPELPTRPVAPAVPWQQTVAKSGPYVTQLSPQDETKFQQWVKQNNVPFDPSPTSDYDMRGFWKSGQNTSINPNDHMIHYSDQFKTPYHQSFSNESQWATPAAPKWNAQDQLVDKTGKVVFDERAEAEKRKALSGAAK